MPVYTSRLTQQEREQALAIHLQHIEQCLDSDQVIQGTMQTLAERQGDFCGEQDEQERRRQLDIEIRTCQANRRRRADAALREMRRRPLTH